MVKPLSWFGCGRPANRRVPAIANRLCAKDTPDSALARDHIFGGGATDVSALMARWKFCVRWWRSPSERRRRDYLSAETYVN
jgi:hypothetical protein